MSESLERCAALGAGAALLCLLAIFWRDPLAAGERTLLCALALLSLAATYVLFDLLGSRRARPSPWRRVARAGALVGYSLLAAFLLGELAFSLVDRSHSTNYTLAGRRWLDRHWWPTLNSRGWRDPEPRIEELADRRRIFVLGDSLAAGHGIADPSRRFPDRLGSLLGAGVAVLNMSSSGWDTRREYEEVVGFPLRPHVLVLSYFGNDVESVALASGYAWPRFEPYADLDPASAFLVTRSYLLNYLYWSWPRDDLGAFWSFYESAWRDPGVRAQHAHELQQFADFAAREDIPLIVVLFPFLHDLERSEVYVPFVREFFARQGIPVIDVGELVRDLPRAERVAGANDAHPSAEVHERVARRLHELLESAPAPPRLRALAPGPRGPEPGAGAASPIW